MNIHSNMVRIPILILTISIGLFTAFADTPMQIFIGTPGNTSINVPEDTGLGTVIGTLQTNADPADITFTEDLSVLNAASVRFDVATNGDITLASVDIDFESGIPYTFNVIANEGGLPAISQGISINITDVNEPPELNTFTNFFRYEHQGNGEFI